MGAWNSRKHLLRRESCPRRMLIFAIKRHVEVPKCSGELGEEQRNSRGRSQKQGCIEFRALRAEANDCNSFQKVAICLSRGSTQHLFCPDILSPEDKGCENSL